MHRKLLKLYAFNQFICIIIPELSYSKSIFFSMQFHCIGSTKNETWTKEVSSTSNEFDWTVHHGITILFVISTRVGTYRRCFPLLCRQSRSACSIVSGRVRPSVSGISRYEAPAMVLMMPKMTDGRGFHMTAWITENIRWAEMNAIDKCSSWLTVSKLARISNESDERPDYCRLWRARKND